MPLSYAERTKARGMLDDKQGVGSIAELFECSNAEIQALKDAKPKSVRIHRLQCAPSTLPAALALRCLKSGPPERAHAGRVAVSTSLLSSPPPPVACPRTARDP